MKTPPRPGVTPAEKIHSMKRRAQWHNYRFRGFYLITLETLGRKQVLGKLQGLPEPHVEPSALGKTILDEEIQRMGQIYPNVAVRKAIVMPDHIHIIVQVIEAFNNGAHLGDVIRGFKVGCTKAYRRIFNLEEGSLFEKGYNDKILIEETTANAWHHYIDDNPRRLWLKRTNPKLFTIVRNLDVSGISCEAIGNMFLLDIPYKEAVIVNRRYSPHELQRLEQRWLDCGENGGVLVSAAIAPAEKRIMREAMNRGYRLIFLRDNGFPKLYKPGGEAFDACANGTLLQLSPWPFNGEKKPITRRECLFLNALAEKISSSKS